MDGTPIEPMDGTPIEPVDGTPTEPVDGTPTERGRPRRMLRLRPFRAEDEADARAAHEAMKGDLFPFLLDYVPTEPWSSYLQRREANSRGDLLPRHWVASTFLAATVEQQLVGRVSIRHELNDWLATYGGHIGYAVIPSMRRRGYGTEILRQGLVVARSLGIDEVLVTCDVGNTASAGVIEACGGVFESVASGTGRRSGATGSADDARRLSVVICAADRLPRGPRDPQDRQRDRQADQRIGDRRAERDHDRRGDDAKRHERVGARMVAVRDQSRTGQPVARADAHDRRRRVCREANDAGHRQHEQMRGGRRMRDADHRLDTGDAGGDEDRRDHEQPRDPLGPL